MLQVRDPRARTKGPWIQPQISYTEKARCLNGNCILLSCSNGHRNKSSDKFCLKYLSIRPARTVQLLHMCMYNIISIQKFISIGTLSLKITQDNAGGRWEHKKKIHGLHSSPFYYTQSCSIYNVLKYLYTLRSNMIYLVIAITF